MTLIGKAVSANGVEGCLLYMHGLNKFMFRVYGTDHTFKDYDIMHNDLSITINDKDAYFYAKGDKLTLDHSPETLGLKDCPCCGACMKPIVDRDTWTCTECGFCKS